MLITFEGIDGCGKSTQIELLRNFLDSEKFSHHVFREPGGTDLSESIRNLLLHDSDDMDPVTELLLFSSARSQLISEKVQPLLDRGEIVILDRYYDSTTAYQGYGRRSMDIGKIQVLNQIASHAVVPDLTFYLKISADRAAMRTINSEKDRMENAGLEFFEKVSAGYDEIAKHEKRFRVIDATQSPEAIHRIISDSVRKHLRA